ncbi:O-antigen ligase family protein [Microvirga sp. M2]|uniref:O-antigen ligase family protein n=1 Tax=Microvirga sp. M2 TaxID=3073270 RepID=UPI0039C207E0
MDGQTRSKWIDYFFIYWLLISTGGFVFLLTGANPMDPPGNDPASYLGRANTILISLATFWIYLTNSRAVNAVIRASWLPFLFPLLAFLSCIWSDNPAITFRRAYALSFSFLAAACLIALVPPPRVARAMSLALGWAILLSVLFVFVDPAYGVHQASDWVEPHWAGHWRGIYSHKNPLGNTASIALLVYVVFAKRVLRSAIFRASVLLAIAACLFGSGSVTGLVVGMAMIAVAKGFSLILEARQEARVLILGSASSIVALVLITAVPVLTVGLEMLGKKPDLTGRVPIWGTILPWANEHPWLGTGYGSFEETLLPRFFAITGENLVNAHNGYLETFINFGYVGVLLLVVVLISFASKVVKILRSQAPYEKLVLPLAISLFTGIVLSNITESFFLAYASIHGTCFVIAYIMVSVSLAQAEAAERSSLQKRSTGARRLKMMTRVTGLPRAS